MIIFLVQIKLFLNIFNYKVYFQCIHYFLFEIEFGWKFFSIMKQLRSSLFG